MAGVTDAEARALVDSAHALGMDALVEVHDADELTRALELPAKMIGINNRDLRSFDVTLETSARLAPLIPAGRLIVGESGIFTPDDVERVAGRRGGGTVLVVRRSPLLRNPAAELCMAPNSFARRSPVMVPATNRPRPPDRPPSDPRSSWLR